MILISDLYMNSMQTCNFVTFYFMNNSFSDVSRKWILPNMIRAVHEIKRDGKTSLHGIHAQFFCSDLFQRSEDGIPVILV